MFRLSLSLAIFLYICFAQSKINIIFVLLTCFESIMQNKIMHLMPDMSLAKSILACSNMHTAKIQICDNNQK